VPGHFKGTEKKFEMCSISCHKNTELLHVIAEVCLYHMHKKMEQLCVFGAWQHNWKLWSQNHDIYNQYTSTTIDTLHWYPAFVALPVKFNCHCYFQLLCFEWYTSKHCPIQSLASHFLQYIVVHCFIAFPVWLSVLCTHNAQRFPLQSSRCHWNSIYKRFSPF
jgi:hypothetical protein